MGFSGSCLPLLLSLCVEVGYPGGILLVKDFVERDFAAEVLPTWICYSSSTPEPAHSFRPESPGNSIARISCSACSTSLDAGVPPTGILFSGLYPSTHVIFLEKSNID